MYIVNSSETDNDVIRLSNLATHLWLQILFIIKFARES